MKMKGFTIALLHRVVCLDSFFASIDSFRSIVGRISNLSHNAKCKRSNPHTFPKLSSEQKWGFLTKDSSSPSALHVL